MKALAAGGLVIAIAWVLLAGGGDTSRAAGPGQTTVTWLMGAQLDRPLIEELAAEFSAANPDIHLQIMWVPAGDYQTKLKTLVAAGRPPDVFYCGDVYVAYLLPFLADLTPLVQRDAAELELDDFYPELLKACQWNGRYFIVPRWFNVSLLYYNQKLFDAANEPYPRADWTWDDYLAAATRLTKRDTRGRVESWGSEIVSGWWGEWLQLVHQSGGELFNDDLTRCLLDTPGARRGLQFYADKVHRHRISPAPGYGPDNGFASGKLAMELGGHTGRWTMYRQVPGLQWDIQLLPIGPAGRGGGEVAIDALGISKDTPHLEQSWRLLKFMISRRSVERHVGDGYLSTRRSVPYTASSPVNVAAAYESLKYARPVPRSPDFFEVTIDVIQPEIDRLLAGERSVDDTARIATQAADRFLATLGNQRRENP